MGRYIKSFKGFGIELEALLQLSVGKVDLIASDAVDVIQGDEKRYVSYLDSLSEAKRRRIRRLTFTINKPNYYSEPAVSEYLNRLRNLKYIEIRDQNKRFQGLVPIRYFKSHNHVEQYKIREFIEALENNTLGNLLGDNIITDYVSEDESLLKVLKKVRNSPSQVLPVVSSNRIFIGVVTARFIEKRITNEVLTMHDKAA
jgi:CBS-domain-containing membrane protein